MKESVINHFLNYEFVYIFLFCSIICLLISIFIKYQLVRKISILFFSMLFILFGFEFGLSFFMEKIDPDFKPNFYLDLNNKQIKKYREIKTKEYTKMMKSEDYDFEYYEKTYDVVYSVYNNGLRYVKCDSSSADSYAFLGCSFTFGDGVNDDETLPYYFSELYNFKSNVLNLGVRGHSSNTALNILNNEIFLPFMDKKSEMKHFFYSLLYDHMYRNFRVLCNEPSDGYILKDKKYVIIQPIVKFKYLFAMSYIFRKVCLPVIDEYFRQYYEDYLIKSLEEMKKIIEEKYNSKLTIIAWTDLNNFMNRLRQTNLDLIFLPEYFNFEEEGYKIKDDGHPTAKANEEIAKILYNHINDLEQRNL